MIQEEQARRMRTIVLESSVGEQIDPLDESWQIIEVALASAPNDVESMDFSEFGSTVVFHEYMKDTVIVKVVVRLEFEAASR